MKHSIQECTMFSLIWREMLFSSDLCCSCLRCSLVTKIDKIVYLENKSLFVF